MKNFVRIAALMASVVSFGAPAIAKQRAESPGPATVSRMESSGPYASAYFYQEVDCIDTEANVYFDNTTYKSNGGKQTTVLEVQVHLSQYNTCDGTQLLDAYGSGAPVVHVLEKEVAAVTVGVVAYDYVSESPRTVSVNLVWQAIDGSSKWNYQNSYETKTSRSDQESRGESVNALVTGSINDGNEYTNGWPYAQIGQQANVQVYSSK